MLSLGIERLIHVLSLSNETNSIEKLSSSLLDGSLRFKPMFRSFIPKANKPGKLRPITIPSAEDVIVMEAISILLSIFYEDRFLPYSHGFRKGLGTLTFFSHVSTWGAVDRLYQVDVISCFDSIDHNLLIDKLLLYLGNPSFCDLIKEFLTTQIRDKEGNDYTFHTSGIPQGSPMSPVLRIRSFIWGSLPDARKVHLVKWEEVCKRKNEGGLSLREMSKQNTAFLSQIAVDVMTKPDKFSVKLLRSKYGAATWDSYSVRRTGCMSTQWRGVISTWDFVRRGLQHRIGDGTDIFFWHDRWLHDGSILAEHVPDSVCEATYSSTIADLVDVHGNWRWDFVHNLPLQICLKLAATPPNLDPNREDCITWGLHSSGKFTVSSAYDALKPTELVSSNLWKQGGGKALNGCVRSCGLPHEMFC